MSQYTEDLATPLVKCTAGSNLTVAQAVEARALCTETTCQLTGKLESSAEIAPGATLVTLPLRFAPKSSHQMTIAVEPTLIVEVTSAGLIKAVTKIPNAKALYFRGATFPIG